MSSCTCTPWTDQCDHCLNQLEMGATGERRRITLLLEEQRKEHWANGEVAHVDAITQAIHNINE